MRSSTEATRLSWIQYVRLWPIADIPSVAMNVRFVGNSGHHELTPSCPLMTQSGRSIPRDGSSLIA
jgi:hypothetical protein